MTPKKKKPVRPRTGPDGRYPWQGRAFPERGFRRRASCTIVRRGGKQAVAAGRALLYDRSTSLAARVLSHESQLPASRRRRRDGRPGGAQPAGVDLPRPRVLRARAAGDFPQQLAGGLPRQRHPAGRATTTPSSSSASRWSWCAAEDGEVRAFHNVCRHRAARLLDGHERPLRPAASSAPTTPGATRSTGAWSAFPTRQAFSRPRHDAPRPRRLEQEVLLGFVFVRFAPGLPSVPR